MRVIREEHICMGEMLGYLKTFTNKSLQIDSGILLIKKIQTHRFHVRFSATVVYHSIIEAGACLRCWEEGVSLNSRRDTLFSGERGERPAMWERESAGEDLEAGNFF